MKIKQGFFFPIGGLICGILIISFAVAILATKEISISSLILSIFLILIGLTFFSFKVLSINKNENTLTEILFIIGFKVKKKKDLNNYCYVTILRQLYSMRSRSRATFNLDNVRSEYKYDLFLINKHHHNKYKIKSYRNLEQAKKQAQEISNLLNFEIVNFNPVRTRKK